MQDAIHKHVDLKAPIERVWWALTDHEQFGTWFRVELDEPFEVGQVSRGRVTYPGYEHLVWEATIETMEPHRLFAFSWCPVENLQEGEEPPRTRVEFRLEPNEQGTHLHIRESGFADLPDDARRNEALRTNTEGWDLQAVNIAEYLGGPVA